MIHTRRPRTRKEASRHGGGKIYLAQLCPIPPDLGTPRQHTQLHVIPNFQSGGTTQTSDPGPSPFARRYCLLIMAAIFSSLASIALTTFF